jgi:hypothetical protein
VRTAITLEEAYNLLEAADPRSPGTDMIDILDIRHTARKWLAVNVLHDSPQCFVWSPSAAWFRIPRAYWWKADWTMDELVNRVGLNPTFDYDGVIDAPRDLHGQEVVVWKEAIETIIAINRKPSYSPAQPSVQVVTASGAPTNKPAKPVGRPPGSSNLNDEPHVQRVISMCDAGKVEGKSRVRYAIQELLAEGNIKGASDDAIIERLRSKVLKQRPDLGE